MNRDETVRIDNGDNTWSTPRRSTVDAVAEGAIVWTYLEQARHAWYPTSVSEVQFTVDDPPPLGLVDRLKSLRRHRDGEICAVTSVDEALLDPELVDAADLQVASWTPRPEAQLGGIEVWEPQSWVNVDCEGGNSDDVHVWDGESRVRLTSSFNARQKTAVSVEVFKPSGIVGGCSGVMLNDRWVLTAAHCLLEHDGTDSFDELSDVQIFSVMSDQVAADDVIEASSYNWSSIDEDYDNDWALIHTASASPTALSDMDLWSGSDDTYTDIGANVHMLGYPSFVLDSNDDCVDGTYDLFTLDDAFVMATAGDRVKFKSDGGPQQSGAPYYFCPEAADNLCDVGEEGEVVALHCGFNSFENRFVGPKASSFRPEAVSIIQNWP